MITTILGQIFVLFVLVLLWSLLVWTLFARRMSARKPVVHTARPIRDVRWQQLTPDSLRALFGEQVHEERCRFDQEGKIKPEGK